MNSPLTLVDKAQIASAVATAFAAFMALITTIQNKNANKKIDNERNAMIKPIFLISSTFEDRIERSIEVTLKNIGFGTLLDINSFWKGSDGITTKVIKLHNDPSSDYKIIFNYAACTLDNRKLQGKLFLTYHNILCKRYEEQVDIEIEEKYVDITEEYNPILKSISDKIFS
ncbi:hypothetical protein [Clostridium estertheticum]|uniref:Uncharacterized protein n=1 Tax=Clostridium estertheticum subsp. estertheticum TaxID=1552 RepID=A0A1J0GKU6_9CLOT|nr:hypothetical protein [Clostridium estertheticum]APC41518.1 hypothetical protein A7L45_16255 [Clostridium estertheticum subsp. estertheticum]